MASTSLSNTYLIRLPDTDRSAGLNDFLICWEAFMSSIGLQLDGQGGGDYLRCRQKFRSGYYFL